MISCVNTMANNLSFRHGTCWEARYASRDIETLNKRMIQLEAKVSQLTDTVELLSKPITFGPG